MSSVIEENAVETTQTWISLCSKSDLVANSGVCALLPKPFKTGDKLSQQVAIFYIQSSEQVYIVSNWDPIGKANVIYRGIIGSIGDEPMIASPLYKQHFSLLTGKCFENEEHSLCVFKSKIVDDKLQVCLESN